MVGLILLLVFQVLWADSWLVCPASFRPGPGRTAGERIGPCDGGLLGEDPAPTTEVQAGQRLKVGWPAHNHAGGFVRLALVPEAAGERPEAFDAAVLKLACFGHDQRRGRTAGSACNHPCNGRPGCHYQTAPGDRERYDTSVGIPTNLAEGIYILQWKAMIGDDPLPYYSCARLRITGGDPSRGPCAAPLAPTLPCYNPGDFKPLALMKRAAFGSFCHAGPDPSDVDGTLGHLQPVNRGCDPRLGCRLAAMAHQCRTELRGILSELSPLQNCDHEPFLAVAAGTKEREDHAGKPLAIFGIEEWPLEDVAWPDIDKEMPMPKLSHGSAKAPLPMSTRGIPERVLTAPLFSVEKAGRLAAADEHPGWARYRRRGANADGRRPRHHRRLSSSSFPPRSTTLTSYRRRRYSTSAYHGRRYRRRRTCGCSDYGCHHRRHYSDSTSTYSSDSTSYSHAWCDPSSCFWRHRRHRTRYDPSSSSRHHHHRRRSYRRGHRRHQSYPVVLSEGSVDAPLMPQAPPPMREVERSTTTILLPPAIPIVTVFQPLPPIPTQSPQAVPGVTMTATALFPSPVRVTEYVPIMLTATASGTTTITATETALSVVMLTATVFTGTITETAISVSVVRLEAPLVVEVSRTRTETQTALLTVTQVVTPMAVEDSLYDVIALADAPLPVGL